MTTNERRDAEEIAQGDESLLREIVAFGNQKFEEGFNGTKCCFAGDSPCNQKANALFQARREAFEQAAEVAEKWVGAPGTNKESDIAFQFIAKAIRALAEKEKT